MYKKLILTKTFFLTILILLLYIYLAFISETRFEGDTLERTDFYNIFLFKTNDPLDLYGLPVITSFFYHKGLTHLFSNTVALLFIGTYFERLMSRVKFIVFFVSSQVLLVSSLYLFDILQDPETLRVYSGASGVIVSMLPAALVMKRRFFFLGVFLLFFIVSFAQTNFDPHLFSYIIGIFLGAVLIKTKAFSQAH